MNLPNVLHILPKDFTDASWCQIMALHENSNFNIQVLVPEEIEPHSAIPSAVYNSKNIKQAIAQYAPDIVHTHNCHNLRTTAYKAGKFKRVHTQHRPEKLSFFGKFGVRKLSDIAIATTHEAHAYLLKIGIAKEKVRMVYCGAPQAKKTDSTILRQKLNISPNDFVVICYTKSNDNENGGVILRTAMELPYNTILVVDGQHAHMYDGQTSGKNISNIRFAEGVNVNIANAIVSFAPEDEQGKLLAAMSLGKPIITVGADKYIIEHGTNGVALPNLTPDDLDDAITRLKEDRIWYEQLHQGALTRYAKRFTTHRMAEEIEKIYRELL